MKNWKTTLAGICGALGVLLPLFGVPTEAAHGIQAGAMALMGWLAADATKG